jgi:hypothetical protein
MNDYYTRLIKGIIEINAPNHWNRPLSTQPMEQTSEHPTNGTDLWAPNQWNRPLSTQPMEQTSESFYLYIQQGISLSI